MGTVIGEPRSFYDKFKFRAEVDGFGYSGWQKIGEPKQEAALVEHWEGGSLISDKDPGRVTVADIDFERGATDDRDMWHWFQETANIAAGVGGIGLVRPNFKRTITIVQLDRDDTVLETWTLFNAFCRAFSPGDWDNTVDEKQIVKMTISYDYPLPGVKR